MDRNGIKTAVVGGFGLMASPMSRHWAGSESVEVLRVFDRGTQSDRHASIRASWKGAGANLVADYVDLIGDGDLDGIFVCCGKNGDDVPIIAEIARRLANSSRGTIPFICHLSTVSVQFVEAAQIFCSEREVRYVNYPLTGGPAGAEKATMLILCGGDPELFAYLEPALTLIGKPKFFGDSITSGCEAKLIGHSMVFNGLMGISTALALHAECFADGKVGGSAQADFFDFLNQGAGGTKQWDLIASRGIRDDIWHEPFAIRYALVDALYTADLCRTRKLSKLTFDALINVAWALSFVANKTPGMATHAIVRELVSKRSQELDAFVKQHRGLASSDNEILERCIHSLPKAMKDSVRLTLTNDDFGVASTT